MADGTVERRIYFFRLEVLPNHDGSVPRIDIENALREIQRLRFEQDSTGPRSRYQQTVSGVVGAWPDLRRAKVRLQLGRVRRSDLPTVEQGGQFSPLPIGRNDGIVETTHLQFFAPDIIASEFNFYGPRATAFAAYCQEKLPNLPWFRLRPLIRQDAITQLDQMRDIRLLSVRVHPSRAEILAATEESMPEAIEAAGRRFGADEIDIVLRARQGQTLSNGLIDVVRSMWREATNPVEEFSILKARGKSEISHRVEEFDLLREALISTEEVAKVPGRTRAIDSASMYTAIERAYNAMRDELRAATGLGAM